MKKHGQRHPHVQALLDRGRMDGLAMKTELKPGYVSPLTYLLQRINDETVPSDTRDRLAIAALSYCHPRISDMRTGKKEMEERASQNAGVGTPWADDLEFENRAQ